MKVKIIKGDTPDDDRVWFSCPACKKNNNLNGLHSINPNKWQFFNGDVDRPTIRESILVTYGESVGKCHSYVTDGFIRFEPDSEHELAGQTVELPDLTEEDLKYFE